NRTWAPVGMLAIPLALQLTVVAANPAPLARYMFAPMFLGIMTIPLLAARPTWGRAVAAEPAAKVSAEAPGEAAKPEEPKKAEAASPEPVA
ncbi:MAG TPA: hypothetical protein VIU15_20155, partial [Streptomyces sp.]